MNENAPIGAYATIKWAGEESAKHEYYISFGEWDETTNTDSAGCPDDYIFFYGSPDDEESYRNASEGWTLIDWSFVYHEPITETDVVFYSD